MFRLILGFYEIWIGVGGLLMLYWLKGVESDSNMMRLYRQRPYLSFFLLTICAHFFPVFAYYRYKNK